MDAEEALTQFSQHGYRITRQRRAVVEVMLESPCPKHAEEIFSKCRETDNSISFPTIYRTLDRLVEMGLVRKVYFGQGRSWFESTGVNETKHHHLICSKCGAKVPFTARLREIIRQEARRNQFKVLDHRFEIMGICKDCQRE